MRRLAALCLVALTACTGGGVAPGPPAARPPVPTPLTTPAGEGQEASAPAPQPTPPPPAPVLAILAGTVSYAQRIALTPEAVVQVELRDGSAGEDDPPVAKQVILKPGQVPIAFEISYEPDGLVPSHRYVLSARISDRGQLQFVTESPIPAIPRAPQTPLEIVVVPVR